jgi:hypothetical protein
MKRHCCCGKSISNTYSECVFIALGIQHALRMRHIFICGLPALQCFSTLSLTRHNSPPPKKKALLSVKCDLIFCTTFAWNISHSKKKQVGCDKKKSIGLHVKYRYFCRVSTKLKFFSTYFRKILKISNFMKICPVGTELSRAEDGQTDTQTWRS